MHNPSAYSTIGSVRKRLADLGIHATSAQIESIRLIHPTERVRGALERADTDTEARAFLCSAFVQPESAATGSLFPDGNVPGSPPPPPGIHPVDPTPQKPTAAMRSRDTSHHRQSLCNSRQTMIWHGSPSTVIPTIATDSTRDQFHIYGGSAALTLSAGRNKSGHAVIFIDAAHANQPRQFDWGSKITLMLTPEEMIIALAVVTGAVPRAAFKHHGQARDKWMEIEHQGPTLFIKVGQAKSVRMIPLGPADAFKLAALLTAQIRGNVPEGARADVTQLVQSTVVPMLIAPSPAGTSRSTQRRPSATA